MTTARAFAQRSMLEAFRLCVFPSRCARLRVHSLWIIWYVYTTKFDRALRSSFLTPARQDSIYNLVHDPTLKTAVKACKSPEDACEMGTLANALKVLDELIAAGKPAPDANAAPSGVDEVDADKIEAMEISAADFLIEQVKSKTGKKELDDKVTELIKQQEIKAMRLIESNCSFATIPSSEKKAREALAASAAGKVRAKNGFVGIFFDPGLLGEPITAPHSRINPINQNVLKAPVILRHHQSIFLQYRDTATKKRKLRASTVLVERQHDVAEIASL